MSIRAAEIGVPSGRWLEFGVAAGDSLRYIGQRAPVEVVGFDSFRGLPRDWNPYFRAGAYSQDGKLPELGAGTPVVVGDFAKTLPAFLETSRGAGPIAFVHIDSDLYTSAKTVLSQLGPRLGPGSVLVFDEFCQLLPDDEFRAFKEAARAHHWSYRLLGCGARGTGSLPVAVQLVSALPTGAP